jgi:hypothetical protein
MAMYSKAFHSIANTSVFIFWQNLNKTESNLKWCRQHNKIGNLTWSNSKLEMFGSRVLFLELGVYFILLFVIIR